MTTWWFTVFGQACICNDYYS